MDRQAIDNILEEAASTPEPVVQGEGPIVFSTGVVIKTKAIPKRAMYDIYARFEKTKPAVPHVWNEQKNRKELNPADPAYLESLALWEQNFVFAITDFCVMRGTELVEKPESVLPIDDPTWVEEQAYFGLDIPQAPALRYLAWIKYVAAPTDEDQVLLVSRISPLMGITEAAVETEMKSFPGDAVRETDPPPATETPNGNRD